MPKRTAYFCDSEPCPKMVKDVTVSMTLSVNGQNHDFAGKFCGSKHLNRWLRTLPGQISPRKPRK